MQKFKAVLCTLMFVIAPFTMAFASGNKATKQELIKSKMIEDLDIIKNVFEVRYAPADWKKKFAGWDLEEQINIAKSKVLAADVISVPEYQRIVKQFFGTTRDYHVDVLFYSTAISLLPFRVQSAEGRYFVAWVSPNLSSYPYCPLAVGDEIIEFDGMPIKDAIALVQANELGNPESATDKAMAEWFLTTRIGTLGHKIPSGNFGVVVKHKNYSYTHKYTLTWTNMPEEISSGPFNATRAMSVSKAVKNNVAGASESQLFNQPFFCKKMVAPTYEALCDLSKAISKMEDSADSTNDPQYIGNKAGPLPNLAKPIWEATPDSPFRAYIYKNAAKKTIGYVRIPSYEDTPEAAEKFAQLMKKFDLETDMLVIDQLDNPGGIVFYMYGIASMLTNKPLKMHTQRVTITQEDIFSANMTLKSLYKDKNSNAYIPPGSNIFGYPITWELYDSFIQHFNFLIAEWNLGHNFTSPAYFYGIENIKPNPNGRYSKPILFLVNSIDMSCADFLPAILQDNKRASIMGSTTAGAGGFILSHTYPNLLGIMKFTFTGSILERFDKKPIENLGVTPDIKYNLTVNDLQNNYVDYVKAINNEVDNLLKKK